MVALLAFRAGYGAIGSIYAIYTRVACITFSPDNAVRASDASRTRFPGCASVAGVAFDTLRTSDALRACIAFSSFLSSFTLRTRNRRVGPVLASLAR